MDATPFVAWGLFSSVNNMPKEKDAVGEDSNASLQLSLACDYMGRKGIYYEKTCDSYSNQDQWKENKMEMKSKAFPSVPKDGKVSDIALELTLGGNYTHMPRGKSIPESSHQCQRENYDNVNNRQKSKVAVGGSLSLGPNETWTSKKRERMENCHDPWCIKKKLTGSDLGSMARLLLASELVESHVFPFWNGDQLAEIKEGLTVSVWDCDTMTDHEMVFKRWKNGANVLIKNWVKDFVKRRGLKVGDEIGLYWDIFSSRFKFSLITPVARH